MSLVYSAGGAMPLPKLAWDFNGTTTDYVSGQTLNITGQAPFNANGKYGQSIILKNDTSLSTTSNLVDGYMNFPSNVMVGLSVSFWIKFIDQPGSQVGGSGSALFVVGENMKIFQYSGTFISAFAGNGNTPGGNNLIGTPLGVWIHYALIAGNGVIAVYVNGVLVDSGTFTTAINNTTTFVRLGTVSGIRPTSAEYDDLRIFDRALTSAQVQSIYNQQGVPGRGALVNVVVSANTSFTGTPLFTQLSPAARSSAVGAFSLRAVNGTSARAVRVKRSSDNAQQDFYADRLGNLLTAPVTGQTLQKWLGGAGANVVTWYDQSGLGNNATGSGSFIYQTSNVNMQWAVKSGSLLTVTSPSTFITNTNFTIHSVTRRTTSSQAPGGGGTAPTNQAIYALSGSGTASYNRIITLYDYQGNRFSFNSLNPTQYTVIGNTGCGLYSTSGPVDYLAVIWNGTTTQMYYNGSTSASTAAATFGNIPIASNFTLLGANAYGAVVGGEFGEIIVFNSSLSASDISKLYSAR
jgi:hypothetical protein